MVGTSSMAIDIESAKSEIRSVTSLEILLALSGHVQLDSKLRSHKQTITVSTTYGTKINFVQLMC